MDGKCVCKDLKMKKKRDSATHLDYCEECLGSENLQVDRETCKVGCDPGSGSHGLGAVKYCLKCGVENCKLLKIIFRQKLQYFWGSMRHLCSWILPP